MTNKAKIISLILAALLCLSAFTACSSKSDAAETAAPTAAETAAPESQAPANEDIAVETSYGSLKYPYALEEIVKCERQDTDGLESYIFSAVLDGSEIKVYTINFAASERAKLGDPLGTVQDSAGNSVYVYFQVEDDIVNDNMTVDQKNTVYAAQETVNDVISSMKDFATFAAA